MFGRQPAHCTNAWMSGPIPIPGAAAGDSTFLVQTGRCQWPTKLHTCGGEPPRVSRTPPCVAIGLESADGGGVAVECRQPTDVQARAHEVGRECRRPARIRHDWPTRCNPFGARNSDESPAPPSFRDRGSRVWLAGRLLVRPLRCVEDMGSQTKELVDEFGSENAEIADPLSDLAEKLEFLCESA